MPTTTPQPGTTGSPNPADLSVRVKSLMNRNSCHPTTGSNTAFLMQDGTVKTGGNAHYGRLGTGDQADTQVRPLALSFAKETGPIQAVNMWHSGGHVLTEAGGIWGWGYNANGEVGDNTVVTKNYPHPVSWGANTPPVITKLVHSHSGGHSDAQSIYAIDTNANLWVWGYNGLGQLGLGNNSNTYRAPYKSSLSGVVDVAAGGGNYGYALALLNNGDVYAAGYNNRGQTGIPAATANVVTWTKVDLPAPCVKITTGAYYQGTTHGFDGHTLWLLSDGRVFAAGSNPAGQIGNSTTTYATGGPVEITSLSNIVDIWSAGEHHGISMALDAGGNLFVWGYNYYGALGLGDTTNRTAPTAHPIKDVASVYFGGTWSHHHSLLLTKTGEVYAAGYNAYGQCGMGHMNNQLTHELMRLPHDVQGKITQVNAFCNGDSTGSQLLDRDGHVWACGYNGGHMLCIEPSLGDRICTPQRVMF